MAERAGGADDTALARGRQADSPGEIPRAGLLDVAWRVWHRLGRDNVSLIAAGLALYGLLAAFPALAATVSLYGFFASPEQVSEQMQALSGVVPSEAMQILQSQLRELASQQGGALGTGAVIGLLIALWSTRKGMTALMTATNVAYNEREERSLVRQVLISMAFVIAAVSAFVVFLALAVATPVVLQALNLPGWAQSAIGVLRWAVLWLLVLLGLAVVYKYAPDRSRAKMRWITWGAALAATLWLVGCLLFAVYVRNFASYGETYGALGGVVILLMWFYLSAYVLLLGAEVNAELEHQTERDSTTGRPRPMGERGAYVADTLGELRG